MKLLFVAIAEDIERLGNEQYDVYGARHIITSEALARWLKSYVGFVDKVRVCDFPSLHVGLVELEARLI